jgi:hypothetical protein
MACPYETRTSTWRSFATISSGLYRFLYEITISHPKLAAEAASLTEADLKSTIAQQEERVESLEKQCSSLPQDASEETKAAWAGFAKEVANLLKTSSLARDQLQSLDKPTMQFSEALSDSRPLI